MSTEEKPPSASGSGTVPPADECPVANSAILHELRQADIEAATKAKEIEQLRQIICAYSEKKDSSAKDTELIQEKQKELVSKLSEFEQITKHIQTLMGLAEVHSDELQYPQPPEVYSRCNPYPGDQLPKVIVCGRQNDREVPKIIVCEPMEGGGRGKSPCFQQIQGQVSPCQPQCPKAPEPKCKPSGSPCPPPCPPPKQSCGQPSGYGGPGMGFSGMSGFPQVGRGFLPPFPPPPPGPYGRPLPFPGGFPSQGFPPMGPPSQGCFPSMGFGGGGGAAGGCGGMDESEELKRKIAKLRGKLKCAKAENNQLRTKMMEGEGGPGPNAKPLCRMKLNAEPVCKKDLYDQMDMPMPSGKQCKQSGNKPDLQTIIRAMEDEVAEMIKELEALQSQRQSLSMQKKFMSCMSQDQGGSVNRLRGGGGPCPQCPQKGDGGAGAGGKVSQCIKELEAQIKEMKTQYMQLQEDFKAKVSEVSVIRVDLDASRRNVCEAMQKFRIGESKAVDLMKRLKVAEEERTKLLENKDLIVEKEQQLEMAKQGLEDSMEELDELKTLTQDMQMQLEDFRNKYLNAQELVEASKRELDCVNYGCDRMKNEVQDELCRVKEQFEAKIKELSPLPDLVQAARTRLEESQTMRECAERNAEELGKELQELKEEHENFTCKMGEISQSKTLLNTLQSNLQDEEKLAKEVRTENQKLKSKIEKLEAVALENDRKHDEKMHEILQLQTQLETLREESARQVTRTKDRCDCVRRTLGHQIGEMERQLAMSRASTKAAIKDRDEIRSKMQLHVTKLDESFEKAQCRIKVLQSHVNYLKSSYINILTPDQGQQNCFQTSKEAGTS